jgi:hypothetical protein
MGTLGMKERAVILGSELRIDSVRGDELRFTRSFQHTSSRPNRGLAYPNFWINKESS